MRGVHRLSFPVIAILLLSAIASWAESPDRVGDWRVEIGPAGNEYCNTPEFPKEHPKPPEAFLNLVRALAPAHVDVSEWRLRYDGSYWIKAEAEPERYDYTIGSDGQLIDITYVNASTKTRERAHELLIKDTRTSLPMDEVPARTLETLAKGFPDTPPREAWVASTIAGTRYLVDVGGLIFYARPDGQIQAARPAASGALEENYPRDVPDETIMDEIVSDAAEMLDRYAERLGFDRQIRRLQERQAGRGEPFRFVVMGDGRSNYDLWTAMLKHISRLEPRPEFIISTGNLVPRGLVKEYREYIVPPLLDVDIPFLIAIGNHDTGFKKLALEYRSLFGEGSLNYFFDFRGYRFIFVDNVTRVHSVDATVDWLDRVLRDTPEGAETIVSFHMPFGNIKKWTYDGMRRRPSAQFTTVLTRHRVGHVFSGHIHAYSTATFEGVDYTISSGAGAGLDDRFGPLGSVHHYIICDVDADGTLTQQVVRFYKDEVE